MNLELVVNTFKGPAIWASIGAYLLLVWLSIVVYVWLDISNRVQNRFLRGLYTLLVAVGGVFALLIYLIVRPRLTLVESAQKKIEEKLMVKEAVEVICPNCGNIVEREYLFCPNCSQVLKKICQNCFRVSQINWPFCPYCSHREGRVVGSEELKSLGVLKRPRGRPKKFLPAIEISKKPRGRPRKYLLNLDEKPKRPRGRPKKYNTILPFPTKSGEFTQPTRPEEVDVPLN